MIKKSSSSKKAAPKKKSATKKKITTKKRTAPSKAASKKKSLPKKAALRSLSSTWKVVCSKEGVLASGLSREQASSQSRSHQESSGHRTTFTRAQ